MFKNMAALISEPGVRRNIGKNLGKFIQRSYNSIKNLRSVLDYNAIKLKNTMNDGRVVWTDIR